MFLLRLLFPQRVVAKAESSEEEDLPVSKSPVSPRSLTVMFANMEKQLGKEAEKEKKKLSPAPVKAVVGDDDFDWDDDEEKSPPKPNLSEILDEIDEEIADIDEARRK